MQMERKRGSTSLTIWKIPIRTSVNGIITCHKGKEEKNDDSTKCWWGCRKTGLSHTLWVGVLNDVQPLWRHVWEILRKVVMYLQNDWEIAPLYILSQRNKNIYLFHTCEWLKCPLISKCWTTHSNHEMLLSNNF